MKIFRLQILFILFFAAKISFCSADGPPDTLTPLLSYKHFGEEDGLNCKTVYEAIQDKDGFMWFATDAGAFRFDGKKFRQYNMEHGVADKEVIKIFQDSYGRIWFLTLNGYFSFWKDGKIYNQSNTPFLKKAYAGGSLFYYFEDSKKRIWFCTPKDIYIIIDGDSVRHARHGLALGGYIGGLNIHEDEEGSIWAFTYNKMFRFFNNLKGDTVLLPQQPFISCHTEKKSEMLFLAMPGGAYRISGNTVSLYADDNQIPNDNKIVNMVADEDNVWFCTQGNGCFKIVNGKFYKRYLENIAITSVYRDRENNLWFNTMGEGVYMLPSTENFVKNYNEQGGLSVNNITSLLLDPDKGFWLGYKNGTVQKLVDNRVTTFKLNIPGDPGYNRITSLAADSDVVFCGTDIGAYSIHNNRVQFILIEETTREMHYVIKQIFINDGNIYIAHGGGLLQVMKINDTYLAKSIFEPSVRATAIVQYPDDRLLVAVTAGLMEYKQGTLEKFLSEVDFSSTRILDMKQAPGDLLAVATNGSGIYFLKDKKLSQHLSTSNGLSDNNCKRIFVADSAIYVATDKGLNVLVKINNQWNVSGVITSRDGLLSNTVSEAAERNGIIYVATDKGLSVFNKSGILRKKFVGRVYATELVSDSTYTVTDTLYSFKADIPRLLIRFAYPVFSPGNELKIKYRLLHNTTDNPEWINSSENNEVEFSSLNPGKYIFQLKPDAPAVDSAGVTNLHITIVPMWWQTNASKIGFVLLMVGLIIFIVRRRIQLQYKKQLQQLTMLESERSRIASDMHDDIGADLTQLSIWSGILKSSEKKDLNVLERITNSSYEVLQKMDQIIWALNSFQNHTSDLVSYLREYASQYLESASMNLVFETPGGLPELEVSAIQKRNIFLTVKELLHNTVKHSGAKNVTIRIYVEESVLNIEYSDDGKGFIPKPKEEGLGNITIQKRMREINSAISVTTSPGKGFNAHLKIKLDEHLSRAYKKVFLFIAGIFIYASAFSSDTLSPLITFKHYGEGDGLHCKTVYEVIQDKEGFLWFATDAGAFRFDGKNFKQYNIEHGVTDKEVLKVFQDSYGRIWFLTVNGYLSFWKDGKIHNPSNTPFLKKAYTGGSHYTYFEDSKRRIWIGTSVFVYIVIDNDSVRIIKSPYEGYRGNFFIHEDTGGNTWSFSINKMFKFPDSQTGDTVLLPEPYYFACHGKRGETFFHFLKNKDGFYKIYRLFNTSVSLYADLAGIIPFDTKILNMVRERNNLWVCTQGSGCVNIVDGKLSQRYFENIAVASVYRDREDNLWFTTMGEGVYMLPSGTGFIKNYNQQSGLSANNITSFMLGGEGESWIGYTNGIVDKIVNNRVTPFNLKAPGDPNFNRVISLAARAGEIFCGTDLGVYSLQNNKVLYVPHQLDSVHRHYGVKQVFVSEEKNVYAMYSGGPLQVAGDNDTYIAKFMLKSNVRTTAMTQYRGKRLLIATINGLKEYIEGQELVNYDTKVDFSSIRILDMKIAPADFLALGTNGNGIYFLKDKELYQHLTTSSGLSDNNCKRIFVSGNIMYISTDKGLNVLVKENEKWKVSEVITTQSGLLSNTVTDVAERNGIIYVATEKGLSVFNRSLAQPEKFIGRVYVTEIITDSVYTVMDSLYSFKSDISRLLIKFSYPVYNPSNDLSVKYRLIQGETDNAEWITSENKEVEFSKLSPGQYIFQLKPDVPYVSSAGITNLYINIIPLWYQTNAARIIFAFVAVSLIILIVRRRIQVQYKKQLRQLSMLEAERSRIASDMHDDIGADLTQLSIWSNILESSQNKDPKVLSRITKSSYEVLQKMDQIIWALNSFHNHTTDLVSYLREFALQYLDSAGIRLSFDADEKIPDFKLSAILKRNAFLVVKELLHNTVKHSGATEVTIKIYNIESVLHIEYRDNGKGFVAKEKEDGLGNITVQKRMKEISSEIIIKSNYGEGFAAHLKINVYANHPNILGS